MNTKLWTRDFTLLTAATALGAAGHIMGGFALSFLVFDETGSTLASALILAIQLIPAIFVPFAISPVMDRLPRKAFLVACDALGGAVYAALGLWLMLGEFSYIGYLAVSLILESLGTVDGLAYDSIYPSLLPDGAQEKGYAVSTMLYPLMTVVMMPLAAILLDAIGIAWMLIIQGAAAVAAAAMESRLRVGRTTPGDGERYTLSKWARDIREAWDYLRGEPGLMRTFVDRAVTFGVSAGYEPLLVAFFRTAPDMTAAMYAMFSVAEFIGRTLGSAVQYRIKIKDEHKFGLTFFIYQFFYLLDAVLLWIPYPLMLVNRGVGGFLGSNSGILRNAAIQRYIPERLRARVQAFSSILTTAGCAALAVAVGALGEVMDYRACMTLGALACIAVCFILVWGGRRDIRKIYEGRGEGVPAQN